MNNVLKYILSMFGIASVSVFCISATAGITHATSLHDITLSEPLNMLLFGVGLIGFGSFIKSRLAG